MAASATTVDVLACLRETVPGRGARADRLFTRRRWRGRARDIKRINGLKGKVLAAAQFTEAEFFIRYLARKQVCPSTLSAT
jgi:NitT/TauT family transport system substrate-binding protein